MKEIQLLQMFLITRSATEIQNLLQNPKFLGRFRRLIEGPEMQAVANSYAAMQAVANSQTAMDAVINSQTAMNAVINSQTALNAVVNSQTALNAVVNSQTALNAVVNSQTALNAVVNSQTAMQAVANSQTAMNAVINSQTALNAVVNSQTAMQAVANSQTAMNAVINSQTALNAVINSQTALNAIRNNSNAWNTFRNSNALTSRQVPTMTSNTAPEGVASASSVYGGVSEAFRAFDKNTNTSWWAASGQTTNQWIAYQFTVPVFVHTVTVRPPGGSSSPKDVRVQKSTDGTNWVDVATATLPQSSAEQTIYVASAGFARHWRLFIVNTYGSEPVLNELNFIGFAQP